MFTYLLLLIFCRDCHVQCAGVDEAAQSHQQVEEVDQDPRGAHQAAAQVIPHRGEMPIPQQLLAEHRRGGNTRGIPAA